MAREMVADETGLERRTTASGYTAAVVVIPTRNRSGMAQNAIESVLSQAAGDVRVLVSDNSTSPDEVESLARYCERLRDGRLHYVRPPEPLAASAHWDWAIRQALQAFDASHFIYLTDRMMFKRGSLKAVTDIAKRYPHKIITYYHDRIIDNSKPVTVEQYSWTGRLLEVDCLHLSQLYARVHLHLCLPRMLNSVVPRTMLEVVRNRFGSFFASIAPDFNFGFRCLEVSDSFIYYDKSPIFHYAAGRSIGASMARGELTRDHADFLANLSGAQLTHSLPAPEIWTVGNVILHEYCVVKEQTKSPRFYELDKLNYFLYILREVELIEDPQARAETRARLITHGTGYGLVQPAARTASQIARKLCSPRAVLNKTSWIGRRMLSAIRGSTKSAVTKRAWLFLARCFGVRPPDDHRFEFDSLEEAIDFIHNFPRGRLRDWREQDEVLKPRELSDVRN